MPRVTTLDDVATQTQTSQDSMDAATRGPRSSALHAAGARAVRDLGADVSEPQLSVGGGALLTKRYQATFDDGTKAPIPVGTYVEIVAMPEGHTGTCAVTVYSAFGGKTTKIPKVDLRAEPKMGHSSGEHADTPHDFDYAQYHGALWNHQPTIDDVAQGYLGDCYLVSAMGAVVASDPKAIMNMFSPRTPHASRYQVRLYRRNTMGALVPHIETIDMYLPSVPDGSDYSAGTRGTGPEATTYATMGTHTTNKSVPMWPALLEKAYSQMTGGYDVAGQGGAATTAMEAITGNAGSTTSVPQTDEEVLAALRRMQGKMAVASGTLSSRTAYTQHGFTATGPNEFTASLLTDQGDAPEILVNTLSVFGGSGVDADGKSGEKDAELPTGRDNGKGKITGEGVSGMVDYEKGSVSVKWDPATVKRSVRAEDVCVTYDWEGLLDKAANVYANHAYIFVNVSSDDLIHLRNPWGDRHPNPMTAAKYRELFVNLYSDAVTPPTHSHAPAKKS